MRRLIINGYGVSIGYRKGHVVIRSNGKVDKTPLGNIDQIIIATRGANISSRLVRACSKNKIDMLFTASNGKPLAKIQNIRVSHVKLRKEQIKAQNDERGKTIAKTIIYGKLRNQSNLLKSLGKNRAEHREDLLDAAHKIDELINKAITIDGEQTRVRNELTIIEAEAAKHYWEAISNILPDQLEFSDRRKRYENPEDPVNLCLNYLYGILAGETYLMVEVSGLDPWFGYLHEDSNRRPALVYDIMEIFRAPVVDRIVTSYAARNPEKMINGIDRNSKRIKHELRGEMLTLITERLNTEITHNNRKRPIYSHILHQAREIAAYIMGRIKEPKAFTAAW